MLELETQESFDVESVRRNFPILHKPLPKGLPLTYLDSGATAQKPSVVIEKEREVYENYYANAYRGVYKFGTRVDDELEAVRGRIRDFIGADSSEEIVFTSGSTMSINLVASGWGRKFLRSGDEILLNEMEHHANLVPWQQVAQQVGAQLRFIPLTPDGQLDLSELDQVLHEKTKLVALTGMSNVLGTINPVRRISERARQFGALTLVDGAQSVPHLPTNVRDDGIDFLAFSGHKLYGPSGVGVLYARRELLDQMDPFLGGGHMIDRVYKDRSTWAPIPAKFEAGTPAIAQAIALGAAVQFLQEVGLDALHQHESQLLDHAHRRLGSVPGLQIHGPAPEFKGAIVSFTIAGAHPEDLAQLLDRRGVFVRHGHHCTMPLHDFLGQPSTVRASLAMYNTLEEIDRLVEAIEFAREKLRLK